MPQSALRLFDPHQVLDPDGIINFLNGLAR
jgi:hypothetical protein